MQFIDGQKLAQTALQCASDSTPTSEIPGTNGGRIACAYAVRYMIMKAGFFTLSGVVTKHPLDNLPTGYGYASSYYGWDVGDIQSSQNPSLIPGDLLFWHTYTGSDAPTFSIVTHVGIYVGNGLAVSNSSSQAKIRSHAWDYSYVIARCRLYAPETNPVTNKDESLSNANALKNTFSQVYSGNYSQGLGVNTGATSNYPEDLMNSSQNILDKEKHSSFANLQAIGDYRIRANMEAIVRGVGTTFGGKYYIKSVRHTIERDNAYSVSVELSRNAVKDSTTTEDLKNTSPSVYNPSPSSDNTQDNTNTNNNNNNSNNYNNNLVVTTGGVYSGTSTTFGQDQWGTTLNP